MDYEDLSKRFTERLSKFSKVDLENYFKNERIICAAIHNPDEKDMAGNPLIYCGYRHSNILWQSKSVSRNPHHQGFLTSKGRWVDRKEALMIALENNQVIDKAQIRGNNLYSEDLY